MIFRDRDFGELKIFKLLFSFSDDHGFSLLHWAAKAGHTNIVDMLLVRGARINATNMGDDTALHLATSHGHRDIVLKVRYYLLIS